MTTSATQPFPYGLSAVPRDSSLLSPARPASPPILTSDDLLALLPASGSEAATKAEEHVKPKLGEKLWNHSMRSYLFGAAIAETQFPDWEWDKQAFFLAALFHDTGCTEKEIKATRTSFEFHSAVLARDFLLSLNLKSDLVDSVVEAIWRHTDFIASQITVTGQLLQLGTLFDNLFTNSSWLHPETIRNVFVLFPREEWHSCFHDTMKKEVDLKPWSHSSGIDYSHHWDLFLANELGKAMEKFEEEGKEEKQEKS